jgi:hypothetical protein
MSSKIADSLKAQMKHVEGGDNINKADIKKDKKIYKEIKNVINVDNGGKKRGRPPKEEGTKKEKLNLTIEPKYRAILKQEADDKGLELGPYIISTYIVEPLRKKYKDL